jgi:hypothetical protein
VALAAAATVRMWYMHSFYPDALSPSKERKVRTAGLACTPCLKIGFSALAGHCLFLQWQGVAKAAPLACVHAMHVAHSQ